MRAVAGTIVAIIVCARTAAAHPPRPPAPPPPPHTMVEVGPWFGAELVDHYGGLGLGTHAAIGRVRGRMTYDLDVAVVSLRLLHHRDQDLDPTIDGLLGRVGANARWIFGSVDVRDVLTIEGWLQAGVGVHAIQWRDGGRMVRPDVLGGVGFSERFGRAKRLSLDVGLLIALGRGRTIGAPTCAGPCDEPTPPVRGDTVVIDQIALSVRW